MRLVAYFLLNVIDDALGLVQDATTRVRTRRFVAEHPEVRIHRVADTRTRNPRPFD